MIKDKQFFAWLDGELSPDEAARVEAEVAADPRLSRLAQEHRALATILRNAFGAVESRPVPEQLQDAVHREAPVISLADAREHQAARKAPSIWVQLGALAATLVLGIVTGNMLAGTPFGGSSPIATEAGRLVASAELEHALYAQLASMPADAGPRIRLTFRDRSGSVCRTFEDQAASGLACLEGGDWRIRSLFQSPDGQETDFRMASGQNPQLMETIETMIDGEPFDAAQERAAMEAGWR